MDITNILYDIEPNRDNEKIISDMIDLVQKSLTDDLLRGRWKNKDDNSHHTDGHCYVAAEALWHLLGIDKYQSYVASYIDKGGKATHWWLRNKITGEYADPTKEQYLHINEVPPYHIGKRAAFLTKLPSKRAKIVIDRVNILRGCNE